MIQRYVMPLGVVASACLAIVGATAQDRGGKDAGAKEAVATSTFTGRIGDVDIGKRTLELKYTPSGLGGTGGSRGKDSGTGTTRSPGGAGNPAAKDTGGVGGEETSGIRKGVAKDTGGIGGEDDLGRNASGRSTIGNDLGRTGTRAQRAGTGGTLVIRVPETARITLDGKAATLGDLRANTYARVRATRGASAGTRVREENSRAGDSGTRARDSRAGGTKGSATDTRTVAPLTADRVEVFSEEPGSGRAGGADGTRTGIGGKDR